MPGVHGGFAAAARAAFTFEQLMSLSGLRARLREQGPASQDPDTGWCVVFESEALQSWAYGRPDGTVSLRLFPANPELSLEAIRDRAPSTPVVLGAVGEIRISDLTPARAARVVEIAADVASDGLEAPE